MKLSITILCNYGECHNAECRYAECQSAKCRYAECHPAEHHFTEISYKGFITLSETST